MNYRPQSLQSDESDNSQRSQSSSVRVAVGIPSYNRGHVLLDTIRQVLAQDPPADEIIVVDQSDWYPEGVKDKLETLARIGRIRYMHQIPPNLPKARNRILKESRADVIIFIDDDVVLSDGFVGHHRQNYYEEEDVVAVAGRVIERLRPPKRRPLQHLPRAADYLFFDFSSDDRAEDVGSFRGCNHSIRREYAMNLGGYDEAFTGVALREEGDMALRIIANGGRIVFDPNASLHHLHTPAGGCRIKVWGDMSAASCVLRFAFKHRRELGRYFKWEVWVAYRLGVANRANLRKPWFFPIKQMLFLRIFLRNLYGN